MEILFLEKYLQLNIIIIQTCIIYMNSNTSKSSSYGREYNISNLFNLQKLLNNSYLYKKH